MDYICKNFPVSNEEYFKLEELFGDLAQYAAWQLIKKNVKNNHTNDQEDIVQELRSAIVKAASYYKRQVYLETSMIMVKTYINDPNNKVLADLEKSWEDRTKHGANKQKFGPIQEQILDQLVSSCVPVDVRPKKDSQLRIDSKFKTYCKAIIWNKQKNIGKQITKEKTIRTGMASLSEFDYLCIAD